MPAKNPRLTITLQPLIAAQLRRLSELTGNSQSSLISELLDGSAPVFERMIRVIEAAQQAQQSIKGSLVAGLDDAQTKVEQQLGLVLDIFDDATRPLLDQVEQVQRRARKASGGRPLAGGPGGREGESTPLSNRGVRSDQIATKSVATQPSPLKLKPKKHGVKVKGVH